MYSDSDDSGSNKAPHSNKSSRGGGGGAPSSAATSQPRPSSPPNSNNPARSSNSLTSSSALPNPNSTSAAPPSSSSRAAASSLSNTNSGGAGGAGAGSSSDFQSDEEYAWIPWYCSLKGNELFCEVDEEYAQDSFNLTGLASLVPNFDQALDLILDVEPNPNEMLSDDQQEMIENDAETLFGLIHARYILTSRGMQSMLDKYRAAEFGRCPRVLCDGQALLPIGLSDQPNQHPVKLYCPRCDEIYHTTNTRHQHIDGAYFGTTFSHLFLLTYPELKAAATATPKATYVPRVFGFRIHKNAYQRALNDKNKFSQANPSSNSLPAAPSSLAQQQAVTPSQLPSQQQQQQQLNSATVTTQPNSNFNNNNNAAKFKKKQPDS